MDPNRKNREEIRKIGRSPRHEPSDETVERWITNEASQPAKYRWIDGYDLVFQKSGLDEVSERKKEDVQQEDGLEQEKIEPILIQKEKFLALLQPINNHGCVDYQSAHVSQQPVYHEWRKEELEEQRQKILLPRF